MRTIDYYHKRRKIAILALGGVCVVCGSIQDLQFDHIDPSTKTVSLGDDWYHSSWWNEILTSGMKF